MQTLTGFFCSILLLAVTCRGTPIPIPRPQRLAIPDNEPEPAIVKREARNDLDSQGTIGLNVFTSPLGGVYSGVGSINPYSQGLGSIGTAYGVNQLNSATGLGGLGGGYYGAAAGLNGLGGLGAGFGPTGGLGGYPGSFGGYPGSLGGLGGYPFGGGLGPLQGGLYSPYGGLGGLGLGGGLGNQFLIAQQGLAGGVVGNEYQFVYTLAPPPQTCYFNRILPSLIFSQVNPINAPVGVGGAIPVTTPVLPTVPASPVLLPATLPFPTSSSFFHQRFPQSSVLEVTTRRLFDSVGSYLQTRIPRLVDRLVFERESGDED